MKNIKEIKEMIKHIDISVNDNVLMINTSSSFELRYSDVEELTISTKILLSERSMLEWTIDERVERCEEYSEEMLEDILEIKKYDSDFENEVKENIKYLKNFRNINLFA